MIVERGHNVGHLHTTGLLLKVELLKGGPYLYLRRLHGQYMEGAPGLAMVG